MKFKKYKMGDIASFTQGKQIEIDEQSFTMKEGYKRFIRIVDYTNPDEPERYVKDCGIRYFVNENDLVMIRYGSQTAGMAVIGKAGIIANNLFKINLDNDIVLNKYMYYLLSQKSVYSKLRKSQNSSTMPAINFGLMNSIEVDLPDLLIQNKIIKILDCINNKIKLNNQINDNLCNGT